MQLVILSAAKNLKLVILSAAKNLKLGTGQNPVLRPDASLRSA